TQKRPNPTPTTAALRPANSPSSEPPKKKAKTTPKSPKPKPKPTPTATEAGPSTKKKGKSEAEAEGSKKSIIIEHCKQCSSFKTRANQVKKGVEEGVEGVNVVVNPDKPRKGCFEIREENGETFVSLLDMKRPFKAMKELDMDQLVSEIVQKIK
ncbi:hypothetical protein Leryth_003233, partial [Lithospermum erythrorhizon]